jgi:hypothetical protein
VKGISAFIDCAEALVATAVRAAAASMQFIVKRFIVFTLLVGLSPA